MPRHFVGQMRIGFFHARDSGFQVRIAVRLALLDLANGFDPVAHALRRGLVDAMGHGQSQAFDRDGLADAIRVDAGVAST